MEHLGVHCCNHEPFNSRHAGRLLRTESTVTHPAAVRLHKESRVVQLPRPVANIAGENQTGRGKKRIALLAPGPHDYAVNARCDPGQIKDGKRYASGAERKSVG